MWKSCTRFLPVIFNQNITKLKILAFRGKHYFGIANKSYKEIKI